MIWDASKVKVLRERLLTDSSSDISNNLTTAVSSTDSTGKIIDKTVHEFSKFLINEAKMCMKTSKTKKRTLPSRVKKGFKWDGKECSAAKRRLQNQAKLLTKNPKDPYILGQYNIVKKLYRKTVKLAKRAYEVETIKNLEEKHLIQKNFGLFLRNLGKTVTAQPPHQLKNG